MCQQVSSRYSLEKPNPLLQYHKRHVYSKNHADMCSSLSVDTPAGRCSLQYHVFHPLLVTRLRRAYNHLLLPITFLSFPVHYDLSSSLSSGILTPPSIHVLSMCRSTYNFPCSHRRLLSISLVHCIPYTPKNRFFILVHSTPRNHPSRTPATSKLRVSLFLDTLVFEFFLYASHCFLPAQLHRALLETPPSN